jgi:hypothetical protein
LGTYTSILGTVFATLSEHWVIIALLSREDLSVLRGRVCCSLAWLDVFALSLHLFFEHVVNLGISSRMIGGGKERRCLGWLAFTPYRSGFLIGNTGIATV